MDNNLISQVKELTETVEKHQALIKGIIDEINKTIDVIGTEKFDWDENHKECVHINCSTIPRTCEIYSWPRYPIQCKKSICPRCK